MGSVQGRPETCAHLPRLGARRPFEDRAVRDAAYPGREHGRVGAGRQRDLVAHAGHPVGEQADVRIPDETRAVLEAQLPRPRRDRERPLRHLEEARPLARQAQALGRALASAASAAARSMSSATSKSR